MLIAVTIFLAALSSDISEQESLKDAAILGESESIKINDLSGRRRQEYLLGRCLLRAGLSTVIDHRIAWQDWQVEERQDLPPVVLQAEQLGLYFSISHSQGWVAVAISNQSKLGLDIEYRRERRYAELAQGWYHESEVEGLKKLSESDAQAAFYRLWTQKEAYIKFLQKSVFSGLTKSVCFESIAVSGADVDNAKLGAYSVELEQYSVSLVSELAGSIILRQGVFMGVESLQNFSNTALPFQYYRAV